MKKGLMAGLLALLCALATAALGEDADAVFRAAHPGYAIAAQEAWGDTAAAVMEGDGRRLLLITLEGDTYYLTVIDLETMTALQKLPVLEDAVDSGFRCADYKDDFLLIHN